MKKIYFLLIFIFALTIFFPVSNFNTAKADNESEYYLVKYSEPKTKAEIADLYNISINKVQELSDFGVFRIELKKFTTYANIGGYSPDEEFTHGLLYYEPDYRVKIPEEITTLKIQDNRNENGILSTTPNDTNYSSQWGLPKISATDAWDKETGSTSNIIAIVDTGIDGTHSDLSGKVLAGYDYVHSTSISANTDSDDQGHGTSVGGVASAITNNNNGISGVDWNARLMPVKVLDSTGYGYSSDVALGIRYAADNGADVINMSLGSAYSSSIIESAVNYAYGLGVVLIAASGNDNSTPISYPARYSNVLAVGATNSSDVRCTPSDWGSPYGSNYGDDLDVVAPGNSIYTTKDGGSYRSVGGTSLATPFVSGLASLVHAYNSNLSVTEIYSAIKDNADKVAGMGGSNFSVYYGFGRVNANFALNDSAVYSHSYVSQNAYPTLSPGQSYTFNLTVHNSGNVTWDQNIVHLGTSHPQDRIPFYQENSGWTGTNHNRVQMQEATVAPGADAHFNFSITVPVNTSPGTFREYFRLVADGITWMEDYGIYWDVTVAYPHYQFVSQTPHSADPNAAYITVSPGQAVDLTLTVRNNGSTSWTKTSTAPIRLGTSKPQDRVSDFGRGPGWLIGSTNRVELTDATVAAGSTTTFYFQMIAPVTPGTYREYFQMVDENVTWMENYGIYWNIRVQ